MLLEPLIGMEVYDFSNVLANACICCCNCSVWCSLCSVWCSLCCCNSLATSLKVRAIAVALDAVLLGSPSISTVPDVPVAVGGLGMCG